MLAPIFGLDSNRTKQEYRVAKLNAYPQDFVRDKQW